MAYLPFYLTPEEFEVFQEDREKQIKSGEHFHEWSSNNIEETNRYGALQFSLLSSLIPALAIMGPIGYISYVEFGWFAAFCIFIVASMVSYAWYLSVGLDNHYQYILSDIGLIQKKNRAEPKWVNKTIQVTAWLSAIGCLFEVVIAGPIALAGSGILILLAFGMIKHQPQNKLETCISMRDNWLKVQYNKRRKVIVMYHKVDDCEYEDVMRSKVLRYHSVGDSHLFCNTISELEVIIDSLENKFNLECAEVMDHRLLFGADALPNDVAAIPFRGTSYSVEDVFELRATNAPLPDWEYR
ncbi:hypothetical protein ACPV5O_00350 [Vibrio maritimus]|uniref:hypothetical protein n=1 Tax=Vibrio maritimus TaxID=990268 RepID=UPI00406939C8